MRKLLNTIYVTTDEMYLRKEGETVVFELKGSRFAQLPIHNIESIVFFGSATVTPSLIEMCSQRNIKISYISFTGRFQVSIQNPIHGNVRLRRSQYRKADDQIICLSLAKNYVIGKVFNSRSVLQRLVRDHSKSINLEKVEEIIRDLYFSLQQVGKANDLQVLLGIEGDAAKKYYSVFNELIITNKEIFVFKRRTRRPPLDIVNALLSYFYTLLAHDCQAALETVGLDPQVGYFHQERPGRSALALDLMEEIRPYLVDRFVVSLINNRQIGLSDFMSKENGAVLIRDESRKRLIQLWQQRKQEEITHPFLKEKIEVGLIPYAQAMLLARYLREDLEEYPPFLLR